MKRKSSTPAFFLAIAPRPALALPANASAQSKVAPKTVPKAA
jgi:hypothetical protein